MTSIRPRAIFVGLSTLDVIQRVTHIPSADEKVRASQTTIAAGGPATNAAVCFSALGGDATLITRISTDVIGNIVREELTQRGIRIVDLGDHATSTTIASILVNEDSGDRAIVSSTDGGRSEQHSLASTIHTPTVATSNKSVNHNLANALDSLHSSTNPVGAVLVDSYETDLSSQVLAWARDHGIPTILDSGAKKPYIESLLPLIDVAVVSEYFLDGSTQDIFASLNESGVEFAVVTAGARAISWLENGEQQNIIPPRASKVVDTLGAGDFFHGAFAYAFSADRTSATALRDSLEFASRIAAKSVQSFGSRDWLDDLA